MDTEEQHTWRAPCARSHLGGMDRALVRSIAQQADAQLDRDIAHPRELVRPRPGAVRLPFGGVEHLFEDKQAVPLRKGTLHLADVDGRVQAVVHVHHNVHVAHLVVARQRVNLDLGHRRAKRKVVERPP